MTISRKKLTFGFVTTATVLVVSSVAYACTVWVGQFTVSNDYQGNGTRGDQHYERVTTYGAGVGMNHCWMAGAIKNHVGSPHTSSTIDINYRKIVTVTDPLDPAYGANVACAAPTAQRAPKDGPYTISYLNTGWGDYVGGNTGVWEVDRRMQRVYVRDCMAVGGHPSTWEQSGGPNHFSVSGGVGNWGPTQITPKPKAEIPDLPGTESAICIQQAKDSYSGAPDGAQAPMIVV